MLVHAVTCIDNIWSVEWGSQDYISTGLKKKISTFIKAHSFKITIPKMWVIFFWPHCIDSMQPDTILLHIFGWKLAQIRLVVWWQPAITWTNVDYISVIFWVINLWTIPQPRPKLLFSVMSLKIIPLKLLPHLSVANELRCHVYFSFVGESHSVYLQLLSTCAKVPKVSGII